MPDLRGSAVPRRADRVVQAEVDGEVVLMSPKDFAYFGTQGTGDAVWMLIDGVRSIDAIVTELEVRYEAAPGVIRAEVAEFIDALVASGLATLD